jgi:hypothetical protein
METQWQGHSVADERLALRRDRRGAPSPQKFPAPRRVSRPAYGLTATFDTASRCSADELSAVFEFEGMNRERCPTA